MAISQELESAIRGSVHSAAGAVELIDICNANLATDTYAAASITNLVVATGLTVGSTAVIKSVNATTVSAASAYVPALSATNAVLATGLTALGARIGSVSIEASNISALTGYFKSMDVTAGMTANALTANSAVISTNMTVGSVLSASSITGAAGAITALTAGTGGIACTGGPLVFAGGLLTRGGNSSCTSASAAFTVATKLSYPVNLISCSNLTQNYFRMPDPVWGLNCNVINLGPSGTTCGLIGATSGQSVNGAASTALASMNATGSGLDLVCDGTNWWKRAV